MYPLICTSNTQNHVDYGIPIVANKSTDYRTCTGTYHRFIPSVPGINYNCRAKAEIKPELKEIDVTTHVDRKSVYKNIYIPLPHETEPTETDNDKAQSLTKVNCVRNIQEKIIKNPPPPIAPKLSEMKDSYRTNYYQLRCREASAPSSEAKCEIEGLGRPLQPAIPPGQPGHWKYLDIYMTDNKMRYPPYTNGQMEKSMEDLPTLYNTSGKYKPIKIPLPGPSTGNKTIYDKRVFRYQLPNRFLSRAPKNVPNMKFKTEYRRSYISQTYSDLYPYINTNGVRFEQSLSGAGPWQNLCPPGMYCTEYCHTGTGWPVRVVVDIGPDDPLPPHDATGTTLS